MDLCIGLMLQQLIMQFPLYHLSNGRIHEAKYKRKFQTFS